MSKVFSRLLWQEPASLVVPEPWYRVESFLVFCVSDPGGWIPFVTPTAQVAFPAQVSLEPEFKRQACLSGDILGSEMERSGFGSLL